MAISPPSFKQRVPWWAKVGVKVAVGRLPVGYPFWRSLSLFRFGGMDRPDWAFSTFDRHFRAADFAGKRGGFVTLEVGPGDSLFTALIARAHGGSKTYLVDVGRFARLDFAPYRAMIDDLRARGFDVGGLGALDSVGAILDACDAHYETQGLESLRQLPDASVDFLFSNAVLQHVGRDEFLPTLRELRRVLKPDAIGSHSIGVWDLFGDALNHLRFSDRVWESRWVRESGLYTNRYRFSELIGFFRQAGFDVEVTEVKRWKTLPTPRDRLAPEFQKFDDDDLRVYAFNLLSRPTTA